MIVTPGGQHHTEPAQGQVRTLPSNPALADLPLLDDALEALHDHADAVITLVTQHGIHVVLQHRPLMLTLSTEDQTAATGADRVTRRSTFRCTPASDDGAPLWCLQRSAPSNSTLTMSGLGQHELHPICRADDAATAATEMIKVLHREPLSTDHDPARSADDVQT